MQSPETGVHQIYVLRSGRDKRVPPKGKLGGACLSCPQKQDR